MKKCDGNYKTNKFKGCGTEEGYSRKYGLCPKCLYLWSKTTNEGREWFEKNQITGKRKIESKKTKIRPTSIKRQKQNKYYLQLRREFLSIPCNKFCPITGELATEIHHKKGRVGELLIDTKFWVAVSRGGHNYIENNPNWSRENGYIINRLT